MSFTQGRFFSCFLFPSPTYHNTFRFGVKADSKGRERFRRPLPSPSASRSVVSTSSLSTALPHLLPSEYRRLASPRPSFRCLQSISDVTLDTVPVDARCRTETFVVSPPSGLSADELVEVHLFCLRINRAALEFGLILLLF